MTDMTTALVPIMTNKSTVANSHPRQSMSITDMVLQKDKISKELQEVATRRLDLSQQDDQLRQKEAHMAGLELGAKEKEDFAFQKFREAASIMRALEENYKQCRAVREGYTDRRAGINGEIDQGRKKDSEEQDRNRRLQEHSKKLIQGVFSIALRDMGPLVDAELDQRLKADATWANSLSIYDPAGPEYATMKEILRFRIMYDVAGNPATAMGHEEEPHRNIADSPGPLPINNHVISQLEPTADQDTLENPPPPLIDGGDRTTVLVTMQDAPASRPASVCDNVNMEGVNDLQFISNAYSAGHHPSGPRQTARRGQPTRRYGPDYAVRILVSRKPLMVLLQVTNTHYRQQSHSAKKRRNDS